MACGQDQKVRVMHASQRARVGSDTANKVGHFHLSQTPHAIQCESELCILQILEFMDTETLLMGVPRRLGTESLQGPTPAVSAWADRIGVRINRILRNSVRATTHQE